ncbi:MAG: hypothetical protein JSS07_07355 [Proteobacteria bacterium]|nr:hypothetical protein [Pseudomonadota bacterium]
MISAKKYYQPKTTAASSVQEELVDCVVTEAQVRCNFVFIRKNVDAVDEILNQCRDFYKINNTPWNVVITEQFISSKLERSLKNINFSLAGNSEAMFIALNNQNKRDIADNIDIRSVSLTAEPSISSDNL